MLYRERTHPSVLATHDNILARRREVRLDQRELRVVKGEPQCRGLKGDEQPKQRDRHAHHTEKDLGELGVAGSRREAVAGE